MTRAKPKRYVVRNGINYPVNGVEKRAEPGDVIDDLPPAAARWMLEQGDVAEAD